MDRAYAESRQNGSPTAARYLHASTLGIIRI